MDNNAKLLNQAYITTKVDSVLGPIVKAIFEKQPSDQVSQFTRGVPVIEKITGKPMGLAREGVLRLNGCMPSSFRKQFRESFF